MGCTPSQKRDLRTVERKQTKVGRLQIIVTGGQFYESAKDFRSMKNPVLYIQVSNQVFCTGPVNKIKQESPVKQSYHFWINSQYKGNGRYVEIELHDSDKSDIKAYGIVEIDSILNNPGKEQQMKVILESNNTPIGFINLLALFNDSGSEKVCFRFENCTLRRKTRLVGDMNVSVRVTIGEQVLQTPKKKDTKQQSVSWHQTVLEYMVPRQIKEGLVQVFDEKKLIGSYKLDIQQILQQPQGDEIMHVEELFFQQQNAGTIKFSVISGQNGNFGLFMQKVAKSTIVLNRSKQDLDKSR